MKLLTRFLLTYIFLGFSCVAIFLPCDRRAVHTAPNVPRVEFLYFNSHRVCELQYQNPCGAHAICEDGKIYHCIGTYTLLGEK